MPNRTGQRFALLEFGSILVCPKKLVELESYSTLLRPNDLSLIGPLSVQCNGITREAVVSAPSFSDVADKVFDILNGRIWAGHNILRFDCPRIREAFAEINRPAPEPRGTIDSLALLTQRFGRRAGNMKMATLANYFGLGQQSHRSLDDVRLNLEVLKYCATVLFLESSLPDIFTENIWVSPNANTRSSNAKVSLEGVNLNSTPSTSKAKFEPFSLPSSSRSNEENHPILALVTKEVPNHTEPMTLQQDPCDIGPSECADFLDPEEVSIPSISVSITPFYRGPQRMQILHKNSLLQMCCTKLKVRFNISTKFVDHAGRPRLSIVVDANPEICGVLDKCDSLAQRLCGESGSLSEWRPVVSRKAGFFNFPTVRLQIPTVEDGNVVRWATDIYAKESSSNTPQKLVFSRYDVAELEPLFNPGTLVDAYFSFDSYDYQQNAGIRLVAKKLIVHSNRY